MVGNILPIVVPIITFVLGLIVGFQLNKRVSDRPFLVNEIYSPLYEEVKMMSKNISEFKGCYSTRYGGPDYSAPLPRDKVPGNVRKSLILTGKYERVPKSLKAKLDDYYSECEEWNSELDIWNHAREWKEGKIKNIEVIDEGKRIIIEYPGGRREEKWSLVGARDYEKYEGIKEMDERKIKDNLNEKRQYLRDLDKDLLRELQDRIRDPSPLFRRAGLT